jgi:hypothetical protein
MGRRCGACDPAAGQAPEDVSAIARNTFSGKTNELLDSLEISGGIGPPAATSFTKGGERYACS